MCYVSTSKAGVVGGVGLRWRTPPRRSAIRVPRLTHYWRCHMQRAHHIRTYTAASSPPAQWPCALRKPLHHPSRDKPRSRTIRVFLEHLDRAGWRLGSRRHWCVTACKASASAAGRHLQTTFSAHSQAMRMQFGNAGVSGQFGLVCWGLPQMQQGVRWYMTEYGVCMYGICKPGVVMSGRSRTIGILHACLLLFFFPRVPSPGITDIGKYALPLAPPRCYSLANLLGKLGN